MAVPFLMSCELIILTYKIMYLLEFGCKGTKKSEK